MATRKSSTLDGSAKPLASTGDGELLAMLRRWTLIVQRWEKLPEGTKARREAEREKETAFDRILQTRATTARGMLGKLDCYPEMPFAEPESASVYDDLRVLCGLPPSATAGRDLETDVSEEALPMTAADLIADAGANGMDRPTIADDQQPANIAKGLRLALEFMLTQFRYQTGVEHGPSIVARMLAALIWRLEDGGTA